MVLSPLNSSQLMLAMFVHACLTNEKSKTSSLNGAVNP
jgi:hypothetical protein